MSVYSYIYAAPLDLAVDAIALRFDWGVVMRYSTIESDPDIDHEAICSRYGSTSLHDRSNYEPEHSPPFIQPGPRYYAPHLASLRRESNLNLDQRDIALLKVFGSSRDLRYDWYTDKTIEDPLVWMIVGRRRVGWNPQSYDLSMIRYDLPLDAVEIYEALRSLTVEETDERISSLFVDEPHYEKPTRIVEGYKFRPWLREQVYKDLSHLRSLYSFAVENKRIVSHTLC